MKLMSDERFARIGRDGLHIVVYKALGRPMKCEHCGTTETKTRCMHWANKSGKYLNDTNDWIRLCYKCHGKYDKRF
jgi:hypothetical protein